MNLGDVIQSIAVERFLPRVDATFDRDTMGLLRQAERYIVVMNGWFTTKPQHWPPAECIDPLFFGFHLNTDFHPEKERRMLSDASIAYFRRYQPIGCRDRGTQRLLDERGVETYYTKCLTLTFERRQQTPAKGKVFVVDVRCHGIFVPDEVEYDAEFLTHRCDHTLSVEEKYARAEALLKRYREEARLVVTTRLHCALPCVAMGIPVVFFGRADEYRTALLEDLGLKINVVTHYAKRHAILEKIRWIHRRLAGVPVLAAVTTILYEWSLRLLRNPDIDWQPKALDVGGEQQRIKSMMNRALKAKVDQG